MRKRLLAVFPIVMVIAALFSFFVASPASAASYHTAKPAKPHDISTICYYRVTATAGLYERSGAGTDSDDPIQSINPYNSIVAAYRYVTVNTTDPSTYTWRELSDGNWPVTTWLQKTSQLCVG